MTAGAAEHSDAAEAFRAASLSGLRPDMRSGFRVCPPWEGGKDGA
jgi:hypothetical protein